MLVRTSLTSLFDSRENKAEGLFEKEYLSDGKARGWNAAVDFKVVAGSLPLASQVTMLSLSQLRDSFRTLFLTIEATVPHAVDAFLLS